MGRSGIRYAPRAPEPYVFENDAGTFLCTWCTYCSQTHAPLALMMPDNTAGVAAGAVAVSVVSNPNIGYGVQTIDYAGGKTRDFYRIGLSANSTGISVYIMGIDDKKYLSTAYGPRLGKASVTGYCIKFRRLGDIDPDVLEEAIRFGFERRNDAGA